LDLHHCPCRTVFRGGLDADRETSGTPTGKDGANGSWCCDSGNIYYEPAIRIKAVDTTGAGDCFNAGFIKAWVDKKSIQECLFWGNIAGGLSTQLPGANNYHLSVEEIEKIISRRKK